MQVSVRGVDETNLGFVALVLDGLDTEGRDLDERAVGLHGREVAMTAGGVDC